MATKSIYKDITIRDKALSRNLLHALDSAQNNKSKTVVLTKKCQEVKGSKIKDLFGAE